MLIVLPDRTVGGAQMFALRLAVAFARDDEVIVTSAELLPADPNFSARLGAETQFIDTSKDPAALAALIVRERIDAINSHTWWADRLVYAALDLLSTASRPRWVVSMHGCYEQLLGRPQADSAFASLAPALLRKADAVAIAAVKNRRVFEAMELPDAQVIEIPYGFEPREPKSVRRVDGDIVFGLVSRPAPDKGWKASIDAFRMVRERLAANGRRAALVLVGGGPYADALRQNHAGERDITFSGWSDHPEEWIAGFDVALLPTWFAAESLPNSIIEYLAQGRPVIASRWAEIPRMLGEGPESAGMLLNVDRERGVELKELADAMERLALDDALRARLGANAARRMGRFTMNSCVASYRTLFTTSA